MKRPYPPRTRRLCTIAGVGLLLVFSAVAHAQQAAKVYRVTYVGYTASATARLSFETLRQALSELGYVQGKNLIVEARYGDGRPEHPAALISEVIANKVDVLVVGSTSTALAAKKATATVPIVFGSVFDPVGSGLVTNLARPGGNITGASIGVAGAGLPTKWIELLKEAVPGISRVAVLVNSANPSGAASLREIEAASGTLRIKLDVHEAPSDATLNQALKKIRGSGAQGLVVTNDPFFTVNRDKLVQFAASERLPAVYFFRVFADAGGLMVYAASLEENFRSAARYVDKILRGAKPGDLPVEQPTRFEFIINMKTARALGLTLPKSLVVRADRVIE